MERIKAVEMVRRIRDTQYILTKDMSEEQLTAYFRKKAKAVNNEIIESLKKTSQFSPKSCGLKG